MIPISDCIVFHLIYQTFWINWHPAIGTIVLVEQSISHNGPHYKKELPNMSFGGQLLMWSKSMRYLGINFLTGLHSICDIDYISRKFYCASNCVFVYSNSLSELMQLYLQQSFCLPILQYVSGSLRLNDSQLKSLNVCWNTVFRKIFQFNRWESVSSFINGLGYLNFTHMYYLDVFKLMSGMMFSANRVLNSLVSVYIKGNVNFRQIHKRHLF